MHLAIRLRRLSREIRGAAAASARLRAGSRFPVLSPAPAPLPPASIEIIVILRVVGARR